VKEKPVDKVQEQLKSVSSIMDKETTKVN